MAPKNKRFSRRSFPKGRPDSRRPFSWGTISIYTASASGCAVVVSKKVLKKAHDRNKAKRRVFEALPETNQAAVIHLRSEALTAPFKEIERDLKEALTQKASA